MKEKRKQLSVYVNEQEANQIKQLAKKNHSSISTYLKQRALSPISEKEIHKKRKKKKEGE